MNASATLPAHTGQHLQDCVTCYAHRDAIESGLRVPAIGDRVIVDATLFGETFDAEVIVVQVDVDSETRKLRIIGRPEGTHVMAFARTEWREVGA